MRQTLKKAAFGLLVGTACLMMTGCSSSAPKHLKSYFNNASSIVSNLGRAQTNSSSSDEEASTVTAVQLDTPTDFTLTADGTYSFKGVEKATQYLIYFCEAAAINDGDDYIYSSTPIQDTGADSYTGKLGDVIQASYGSYLVKLFALPDLTDASHAISSAVKSEYTYSGEQSDPQVDYFWNALDSTMEVVLTNVADYTYESYPDVVEVIFTDTENPADVVSISIEDITADTYSAVTDQLKKERTYGITAVSKSSSDYVTNHESNLVNVADSLELGDRNILSDGYTWSDGWASFPRLTKDFDLAGGVAGQISGRQGAMKADIVASSADALAGSDYSYTILVDFGGFALSGTLELKSDGTMELQENGGGPVSAGTLTGIWVENGDGTATLSFAPADISS